MIPRTNLLLSLFITTAGFAAEQLARVRGPHGAEEWRLSAVPVRPGEPGRAAFWNTFAKRFIYAPAFDFRPVPNAARYKYEVLSLTNLVTRTFESDVPHAPLSPVWASVPVGHFELKVFGLSAEGSRLGLAGQGKYFRAAPFDGPYHEPVMPYDQSGLLALDRIIHKDYVQYWLKHRAPDPDYNYYRYPAKIFGSLIVGAVSHARGKSGTDEAATSTTLARIVADYLIGISFRLGTPLEHFPPTYGGHRIEANRNNPKSHAQLWNTISIAAAEAGHAFLDLYDHTHDEKYLEAARRIGRTYLKIQLPSGSWYLYVNSETGKPTANQITIPTAIVIYLERLKTDYAMRGLENSIGQALHWILQNPVRTFDWIAQYEDVDIRRYAPYQKMSREQACDLAIYLFRHRQTDPEMIKLAEELIRFSEDQFVTWEQMEDLVVVQAAIGGPLQPPPPAEVTKRTPGWYSRNWLTPAVHEQYGFWMPSARNTGLMIETYWHAYTATKKRVYLDKAVSIANNFTRVQQLHDGDYPTMFTKYPMQFWINNSIYPAKVMMNLHRDMQSLR